MFSVFSRLPDGNSSKRKCPGCERSSVIFPALLGSILMTLSAVLQTIRCSLLRTEPDRNADSKLHQQLLWQVEQMYANLLKRKGILQLLNWWKIENWNYDTHCIHKAVSRN